MFGSVARTSSVKQRRLSLVRLNLEPAKLEAGNKAIAPGVVDVSGSAKCVWR